MASIINVTPRAATMPNSPRVKLRRPRREMAYMLAWNSMDALIISHRARPDMEEERVSRVVAQGVIQKLTLTSPKRYPKVIKDFSQNP
jgi:hypothetical protein